MTEETKRKRNTNGALDEFSAASRICRIIAETNGTPLAEEVRIAVEKRRAERKAAANEQIARLMARVPEGRRAHVGKHVLAAGYELGGFEITSANDAPTHPDSPTDDAVAGMGGELPEGARPMDAAREKRIGAMTGKGRQ